MDEVVEYKRVYENVICENRVNEQSTNNILIKVAHREKYGTLMCIERILYVEELIIIAKFAIIISSSTYNILSKHINVPYFSLKASHRAEHSSRRNFPNYSKCRKLARKNSNQPMKSQHFSARRKFETNQLKSRKFEYPARKIQK